MRLLLRTACFVAKDLIGMYYKTNEALFMLVVAYLIILLPISVIFSVLEVSACTPASGINILFEGQNMARLMSGLVIIKHCPGGRRAFIDIRGDIRDHHDLKESNRQGGLPALSGGYPHYSDSGVAVLILLRTYKGYGHPSRKVSSFQLQRSPWGTAEMGDIVRGAVTSMPRHQTESGLSLGLTKLQIYRYILVPQTVRRVLPGAINLATRMVKTTSLVVIIGVVEVLKVGQQIIEEVF